MSQISGFTNSTQATLAGGSKTDAYSSLTSEQFVKIIFAELSRQDPLKPNDSNAIVEQLANIRSIESDIDMQSRLKDLVAQNQLSTAGGLLGAYVRGTSVAFEPAAGTVAGISQTKDGPVLALSDGSRVKFSGITEVLLQAPAPAPASTPPPTDTDSATTPSTPAPAPPLEPGADED